MNTLNIRPKQNEVFNISSHVFHLYIAGESANSVLAQRNIKVFCDNHYGNDYQLKLIDVLLSPEQAWNDGVTATPMLLRISPLPQVKMMGNLSDKEQLSNVLI
jgi:circadian clock protein KaiB